MSRFFQDVHGWCPECNGLEIFISTSRAGRSGGGDRIHVMHRDGCLDARDCQECGGEVHPAAGFVEHFADCESLWDDEEVS